MTDLAKTAEKFVASSTEMWAKLVDIALALSPKQLEKAACRLGKLSGISPKTVRRKFDAIRLAQSQGQTAEAIKKAGQEAIVGGYVRTKHNGRTDKQVALRWMVAPELRDAAHEEAWRVAKILNFRTSNEFWQWLTAVLSTATEEEIRHSAGDTK